MENFLLAVISVALMILGIWLTLATYPPVP